MVAPEVKVVLREVSHDVNNFVHREITDLLQFVQRLQHKEAKLSRPCAQLDDVKRFAHIERHLAVRFHAVSDEAMQDLRSQTDEQNQKRRKSVQQQQTFA